MKDFRKLKVWEKAHEFVKVLYNSMDSFPNSEKYNIVSQLQRAAVSIPTNIVEGAGSRSEPQQVRYYDIAIASCNEVEYLLLLSSELGFIDEKIYSQLSEQVIVTRKMLFKLTSVIKSGSNVNGR